MNRINIQVVKKNINGRDGYVFDKEHYSSSVLIQHHLHNCSIAWSHITAQFNAINYVDDTRCIMFAPMEHFKELCFLANMHNICLLEGDVTINT